MNMPLYGAMSLVGTLTMLQTVPIRDSRHLKSLSNCCQHSFAAFHFCGCVWTLCVQDIMWERYNMSPPVWASELCLWAEPLQTMSFIVCISSSSCVRPWKLCFATDELPVGASVTKKEKDYNIGSARFAFSAPAVSSAEVWPLQPFSEANSGNISWDSWALCCCNCTNINWGFIFH